MEQDRKVSDISARYIVKRHQGVRGRYASMTYDKIIVHKIYGVCRMVIFRAIGNDNGVAGKATITALKIAEPDVGFWPGDRIEYRRAGGNRDGQVIEVIYEP